MAPPRELMDELVGEILLRLPPDEPAHLFRAALVCKTWLRVLCHPGFRRRYRAFHGAPPLLGLLHRLQVLQGRPPARFASTTSMPDFPHPGSDGRRARPLDCRHGRVLVYMRMDGNMDYLVWDPVTGDRHGVPAPDIDWLIESAVVLCAADGCDHLDCQGGGPFRVVFAATHEHEDTIFASVYSSETGVWSVPVCLDKISEAYVQHMAEGLAYRPYYTPYLQPRRGALVGDALYFTVRLGNAIIKYDLGKNRLSMIDPNPTTLPSWRWRTVHWALLALRIPAFIRGQGRWIQKKLQDGYNTRSSSWRKHYLLPIPMTYHVWLVRQRVWVSSS
ncbi:hypothetical protein ACQJBY_036916 [Aegilops geniculata]